ncbi:MAG: DUF1732 domain-containing protein, partial [Vicinamibacteria bacterium]|nr:DUF1732 domain-containing protein [Vicinamibacteria bacterium]
MIRSMTGYGSFSAHTDALRASVTVRSLNHRYLDISLRLAPSVSQLEPVIRSNVQKHLGRGRVEVTMQAHMLSGASQPCVLNAVYARRIVPQLRSLAAELGFSGEATMAEIAHLPGVMEKLDEAGEMSDADRAALLALLEKALSALETMRCAEGQRLLEELGARLLAIETLTASIEQQSALGQQQWIADLHAKIERLRATLAMDDERVSQEIVRLVDRSDVREEIVRLRSHVQQARQRLERG